MNIEVRQKIDALSLDIKQLEAKQTFTATIMMMISSPDTCEDTIRQRQNNILVEIMKHNATLLLSCIVTLFTKLVAILCPETLVRSFEKNGMQREYSKSFDAETELRSIESKYRHYVYNDGIKGHTPNSSEEYENTINVALSLLDVLLGRPNQRDVSSVLMAQI